MKIQLHDYNNKKNNNNNNKRLVFVSRDRVCHCTYDKKPPKGSQSLFTYGDRACECFVERHLADYRLYLSLAIEYVDV